MKLRPGDILDLCGNYIIIEHCYILQEKYSYKYIYSPGYPTMVGLCSTAPQNILENLEQISPEMLDELKSGLL